ncbi:MAG: TetR/AcrR family transcriptional regulator [Bacteroidota bacterium]
MKRTTRNAAKTKQEIIEKSAPIFNVHGFAGTSMQMLVQATGYQMGGIYRHFDTKMELAKSVFQYNYEMLTKQNFAVEASLNPKEQLLAIIDNYKDMIINPQIIGGCPILNTVTEVDDTDEEFRLLAKSLAKEILLTVEAIFSKGIELQLFKASIDPKKEALYLFATIEGAILIGKLSKSNKSIFDILETMGKYLEGRVFVA